CDSVDSPAGGRSVVVGHAARTTGRVGARLLAPSGWRVLRASLRRGMAGGGVRRSVRIAEDIGCRGSASRLSKALFPGFVDIPGGAGVERTFDRLASGREPKQEASRKPSHIAYWVKDLKDGGIWKLIAVAWEHADKKGFNVVLDLQPLAGRITLRVPEDKEK